MATQPKLIDYNGKQYDYSALKENVYKNYDTYARRFGYSRSKYEKDRQGLAEILGQLELGNGTIQPDQIVFNSDWGNERGSFGKARNKSRHYKNPTWMIIDTLQGMDTYNENDGKKKLNQSVLNQELSTALAKISELTYEGNKLRAQQEAIQNIINKYGTGTLPEGYVLDKDFNLPEYITKLNGVLTALSTTERDDDDEYAYYQLGITNPSKKEKPAEQKEEGVKAFIKAARDQNITEVMMNDDALSKLYYEQKVPQLLKQFYESQGLTFQQTQTQQSSQQSSSSGVSAGSTTTKKEPEDKPKPKSKPETPPKTSSYSGFKLWYQDYRKLKTPEEKRRHFSNFNADWTDIPRGRGEFYRDVKGKVHVPSSLQSRRLGGYLKLLKNYK